MRKGILVEAGKTAEVTIVAPKEMPKQVSGQVLDENGKPLANTMVRVRGRGNPTPSGLIPNIFADTKTDSEGKFTFLATECGYFNLTVYVDGYEPAKVEVVVGDEKVKPEFIARLRRVREVKGDAEVQVVLPNGKPLSGVWVSPLRKNEEWSFPEWDWQIERGQFTGKDGKVRFNDLPAGVYLFIGLPPSDELTVAVSRTVQITRPEKVKLKLSFPPTGRIVGQLVDEEGKPIAGEVVGVWAEKDEQEIWLGFEPDSTVTKDDGSFVLERLPKGTYTISTSFGFPSGMVTTGQRVHARGDETVKVKVRVWSKIPTASISGEVIDSTGKPVSGAMVTINSEPMLLTLTDENGRFSFNNLPTFRYGSPATYSVTVSKQGFASKSETVKVEKGKTVEVSLMLERGATIEGRLIDEKGEPVGGMVVYAIPLELACSG